MNRRPKQTFYQRKHTDGQQAHEKMLIVANLLQKCKSKYKKVPPYTSQNGCHQKVYKQ